MTKRKSTNIFASGAALILVVGAFFVANVPLTPEMAAVSSVNVLLFAVPAAWATFRWLGVRHAVLLWLLLGIYALLIETFALFTAFPYGGFSYGELIGFKLFGMTPWTVPFAWTPLALATLSVSKRLTDSRAFGAAIFCIVLIAFDLVIDPGAVRLGFWKYASGGAYYGVPLSNFLGWIVSSLIAYALAEIFLKTIRPVMPAPAQLVVSAAAILVFWSAVAAFSALWLAAVVGVLALAALAVFWRKFYVSFDDLVVLVDEENQPIGTALKSEIHTNKTPLHRAFSVFLFNEKGELLLQQRAFAKKTWGGVWSNSCCGHVMLHEKLENAAKRRMRFELGIFADDLRVALPDFRYRAEKDGVVENEICPVLIGRFNGICKPNPDEVEAVKWIRWEDFVREMSGEHKYSPWAATETRALLADETVLSFIKTIPPPVS